ncbi:hypothetical protein [Devosia sp. A449]
MIEKADLEHCEMALRRQRKALVVCLSGSHKNYALRIVGRRPMNRTNGATYPI